MLRAAGKEFSRCGSPSSPGIRFTAVREEMRIRSSRMLSTAADASNTEARNLLRKGTILLFAIDSANVATAPRQAHSPITHREHACAHS
jgi:hypothetical protein